MIDIAVESDGSQIVELTRSAGVFNATEIACVEELWGAYLAQGEASGYSFLVYRDADRVQGYACFGPHALTEGTFDLYWLAVYPGARRKGVGRALTERAEQEVKRRGGRLLLVETSGTPAYAPARRFYENCGYRYEAVVHDFYSLGDDLLIFAKRLSQT